MLYTSKVAAGIYLKTEPTNQYPIIAGQTTYWKVMMKRMYDNSGPTNDPAYIYIGQSNDMSHADEFMADNTIQSAGPGGMVVKNRWRNAREKSQIIKY